MEGLRAFTLSGVDRPDDAHETHGEEPSPTAELQIPAWAGLLAGVLAAAVALAVGELVAGFSPSWQSLVVSVDNQFIDGVPGNTAQEANETVGKNNKPLLITGTVLVAFLLGAVAGRRTLRTRWVGPLVFGGFALLGAAAGLAEPDSLADPIGAVITAVAAGLAGVTTLLVLLAVARAHLVEGSTTAGPLDDPVHPAASRRAFFGWAGGASAVALTSVGLSRVVGGPSAAQEARESLATGNQFAFGELGEMKLGLESEIAGIAPLYTPNASFYRIDTALSVPNVDPSSWALKITGLVDQEVIYTFDDLLARANFEADITMSCVSNQVGGDLIGNARWTGIQLSDLLDEAGVQEAATQIVGRSVDDWTAGFPTAVAYDGRPALVALAMNGEPLPISHGFPARLVVSGLYGYVSATKWLKEIELTTWEDFNGYWVPRGWSKEGPIKTQSRIDVPSNGDELAVGTHAIGGVAWAGIRAIERVEIRIDQGAWQEAQLGEELANTTWRQWYFQWDATAGPHKIEVRATDGDDVTQTEERSRPDPDGATGWHAVMVDVA